MLSLYICAKLFADIVCHTNYRYISEYICISMLLLPIVYSQNAWRYSHLMVSTAGIGTNVHLIFNNDRKHIPNNTDRQSLMSFYPITRQYTLSDQTRGNANKTQLVIQRCIHCDCFIVCRKTMRKEDNPDDNAPLMLFIYVCVLYGYASGTHLFLMLILQNIVLCHKATVFCK